MDFVSHVQSAEQIFISKGRVLNGLFELRIRASRLRLNFAIEPEAQSAQENSREEFPLAYANVQQILLIVFELNPRAAIGNDLRDVDRPLLKEDARRTMQL